MHEIYFVVFFSCSAWNIPMYAWKCVSTVKKKFEWFTMKPLRRLDVRRRACYALFSVSSIDTILDRNRTAFDNGRQLFGWMWLDRKLMMVGLLSIFRVFDGICCVSHSGCGVTNSKRRFIQRCLCLVRIVPCLAETQTKCRLRSCCEMSTVRPYAECQCRGNTSRVHVSITATCARCVCLWSFKMCVLSVACNVNGSFIWCLAVNQAN